MKRDVAYYHLPGLFEFYELYQVFLPLFRAHREYFYPWCRIGSIYGAPSDCLWGGGRVGCGEQDPRAVLDLMAEYDISARLTFSNSLLRPEHLSDPKCNALARLFAGYGGPKNGVIVHSDLLLRYLQAEYPGLYFVSSTTKVLTDFDQCRQEAERADFAEDLAKASGAIKELWGCTKLNLGSFGDTNPHLHFHIVPKYEGGFEFGGAFAITNPEPVYLKDEEYQEMISALKAKLGI